MTNWHTLSGRFTDDEVVVIQEFKRKNKISDNELIRAGVQVIVGMMTMYNAMQNPDIAILKGFAEELNKEVNSPHYQRAMQKASDRWAKKYKKEQFDKLELELTDIQNKLMVFEHKRTRGRPKKEGVRGRPAGSA